MAIVKIETWDNFDQWRQKTNLLGGFLGEVDLNTNELLVDPVFFDPLPTNVVDALNAIVAGTADKDRRVLIKAIAMS